MCSYRGSSQSRAGTEGQPSPSSSPHNALHGQRSGPPGGRGCLLHVSPSYEVQPAGENRKTVSTTTLKAQSVNKLSLEF